MIIRVRVKYKTKGNVKCNKFESHTKTTNNRHIIKQGKAVCNIAIIIIFKFGKVHLIIIYQEFSDSDHSSLSTSFCAEGGFGINVFIDDTFAVG